MEEMKFTVSVRGEERIKALLILVARDHSNKSAVLNKGLDLLVAHEERLKRLAAAEEVHHAS